MSLLSGCSELDTLSRLLMMEPNERSGWLCASFFVCYVAGSFVAVREDPETYVSLPFCSEALS